MSNNNEAEINILKARNKLEEFVKQASASETNVNIITTIDHNATSGIARVSREIIADIIILGWPGRAGFIAKLIGEKVDGILNNTDKTTFICLILKPLVLHKRMVIAAPPFAEHEDGFEHWLTKIVKLAQELSIPIQVYSNESTGKSIKMAFEKLKLSASISYSAFSDWEDFLIIGKKISKDDLFILVSTRKGSTSYMPVLENLPLKLEKHFPTNNLLIIYPQQFNQNQGIEHYDDISAEPLSKGIETILKIRKRIGSVFKKANIE